MSVEQILMISINITIGFLHFMNICENKSRKPLQITICFVDSFANKFSNRQ